MLALLIFDEKESRVENDQIDELSQEDQIALIQSVFEVVHIILHFEQNGIQGPGHDQNGDVHLHLRAECIIQEF